jgi:uncharacterized protein YkwD
MSWPTIDKQLHNTDYQSLIQGFQTEFEILKSKPEVKASINTLYQEVLHLLGKVDFNGDSLPFEKGSLDSNTIKKPDLTSPTQGQLFSINNVQIGDSKEDIEHNLSAPKRTTFNEYGVNWNTYHENYQNFFMLAYDDDNEVAGLYTNQDLLSSTNGIKRGTPRQFVREKLGEPITKIRKGMVQYQYKNNDEYDLFLLNDIYITVFYDLHENDTVTAILMVKKELEQNKPGFYQNESQKLKEGFEYQLFDLTNATRVNHGLSVLTWNNRVRQTARDHSMDMAVKNYFDHTDLDGKSPFDRMEEDHVVFNLAGENLATGQFSSIFAHEGLMNSLGHRENILREDYEYLGVGVAFNKESQPYYTENFFAN